MSDDALAVFRRLAVKQGVQLSGPAGKHAREFEVALAAAATALPAGRSLNEFEVNAALKAWLAGPGAMLVTDHVELRRWLVDVGLWSRDGYGRAYQRSVPPAPLAPIAAAFAGIDLAAVAAEARAAHEAARTLRRARHQTGPAPT
jgi:hypothetical protein